MKPTLRESRPIGTPLARQRWECSQCGLVFEPNFEDGKEMTIRRRIDLMKKDFEIHAAWHLGQAPKKPSVIGRLRTALNKATRAQASE